MPKLFFFYFRSFQTILQETNSVDFVGIQTQIARVESKPADHYHYNQQRPRPGLPSEFPLSKVTYVISRPHWAQVLRGGPAGCPSGLGLVIGAATDLKAVESTKYSKQ